MPLFFIEMGQGIIARPDLRVRTSALYSCTLIAGHNTASGYAGAFHYPSGTVGEDKDVLADMEVWIAVLRPTVVTLVFASDASGFGQGGTPRDEQVQLTNWVRQQCGIAPATTSASAAGMELSAAGVFNAGNINTLAGNFDIGQAIRVETRDSGRYLDHDGFTLIGRNRES